MGSGNAGIWVSVLVAIATFVGLELWRHGQE